MRSSSGCKTRQGKRRSPGVDEITLRAIEDKGVGQFLHSAKLGFPHPRTGQWVEARAPLAQDLRQFLENLVAAEGANLTAVQEYF